MSYIEDMFHRANIDKIVGFIMSGTEMLNSNSDASYKRKLEEDSDPIYERIEHMYSDKEEERNAMRELTQALNTYAEIYMEIGIKMGIKLSSQLCSNKSMDK